MPRRKWRRTFFEWVEVESCELESPCTMVNTTLPTFDLVGEARKRGWCEHELVYHIFEFGVSEGLRCMEAHMMALPSAGEGSESVLRGRRIIEVAAEEVEANSVIFPGRVCRMRILLTSPHRLLGSGRGLLVERFKCGTLS